MQKHTTRPSPAIQLLDELLNHALLTAGSKAQTRAAWAAKVAAKRHLETLPPEDIERVAGELLDGLRTEVAA